MKHLFKKHEAPVLDWSDLEPSESEPGATIQAIISGDAPLAVYLPGEDRGSLEEPIEGHSFDPLESFNAEVTPHQLSPAS